MTQPKMHTMSRGLFNPENIFYLWEKFKNPKNFKTSNSCPTYEVIKLGTTENPKNIDLGKSFPPK